MPSPGASDRSQEQQDDALVSNAQTEDDCIPGNLTLLCCLKNQTPNGTSKHIKDKYFCPIWRKSTLQRHKINKIYLILPFPLKEVGPKICESTGDSTSTHTFTPSLTHLQTHHSSSNPSIFLCISLSIHPCFSFSHNHTGLDKRCIQVQSTDINSGSILSTRSSKNSAPRNLCSFCGMQQAQSSSHVLPGTTKGCHSQKAGVRAWAKEK